MRRHCCVVREPCITLALVSALALPAFSTVQAQDYPPRPPSGGTYPPAQTPPSDGNYPPGRDERPPPRHDSGSRGGGGVFPWALGALFGAIFAQRPDASPGPAGNDDYLERNGPRPADSYKVGTFVVEAFVQDRWPLVVDFLPQPDSCTALDVYIGPKRVFSRLLDADGLSGRRLVTVSLPDGISQKARPALYVVHSDRPACAGAGAAAQGAGAALEIYGIGGGPRAVGSVAVNGLEFGPATPKLPQQQVQIAYRTQWPFNHVSVEVLRFHRNSPERIDVERVLARRNNGPPPGRVADQPWDGRNGAAELSLGVHRLQVRAWMSGNEHSWVGAISPTSVLIAQDAVR